jgi:hypothetical protein
MKIKISSFLITFFLLISCSGVRFVNSELETTNTTINISISNSGYMRNGSPGEATFLSLFNIMEADVDTVFLKIKDSKLKISFKYKMDSKLTEMTYPTKLTSKGYFETNLESDGFPHPMFGDININRKRMILTKDNLLLVDNKIGIERGVGKKTMRTQYFYNILENYDKQ